MVSSPIYLKGLNGIRAIAAIAVLISHITMSLELYGLSPYIFGSQDNGSPATLDLAGYGVSMFFVLSGFLITYLLWEEKSRQPISIKKFYLRRILRIWPLYYAYLLICLLVYFLADVDYEPVALFYYVFFSANIPFILSTTLPYLVHFWSIGVEEQFYLFWPWLNKLKKNRIKQVTILLAAILIATKTYLHLFQPGSILELAIHVTRFHCMLIGALFAMLYREKVKLFLHITTNRFVQAAMWFAIFLVAINKFHLASFLDNEFISVVTAIIIIGQITEKGLLSLENSIFNFLGKISYGIYVIHPLLIYLMHFIIPIQAKSSTLNYISVYSIIIGLTIYISFLSYQYFERPFMKLKNKKFTVVASTSSR